MSNIKQALESAIEWIERYADRHGYHTDGLLLINKLKISLDELEKCEPVAYLKFISRQWLVSPEIGMDGFEGFEVCDKYGKGDDGADAFAVYTSPQPRDWVGLSDLDIADAYYKAMNQTIRQSDKLGVSKVAKAIEAKCKQLNTKG